MIAVPALALSALLALVTTPSLDDAPPAKPKLRVAAKRVEFGDMIQGDKKTLVFEIHNDGDAPLSFVRVTPTCGCLSVAKPTESIAPGKSLRLEVDLDTGRLAGGETTKMVMLVTNDRRAGQVPLEVHGKVITLLAREPADLFARVFPGETPRMEALLRAATPRVTALLAARTAVPDVKVTLTPDEAGGGTLIVEGPAGDEPRTLGINLEIDVRMKDGSTRTARSTCRIEYRSRWELSQRRRISFTRDECKSWEKDPSSPLTKSIDLRAVAPGFRVELESVTITGAEEGQFACETETVVAGAHYRLHVRLMKPVAKRFARGKLIIRTNDPLTPEVRLDLRAYRGR